MPTASSEKRTTTITVDLGDLKAPWQAWCQDHGDTPSHALRNALRQAMDRKTTQAPAPRLCVTRRRERATARMKLNVTPSELAALRICARHEGYQPTAWVVAMIRTKLTGEPHVGQPELAALTRSNQQLLALGRNLNQIAKVLNTAPRTEPRSGSKSSPNSPASSRPIRRRCPMSYAGPWSAGTYNDPATKSDRRQAR